MEPLKNEEYHILVVEDDKEIRDGIEIFLKSQGYQVHKAADGIEGLSVIENNEIHLAIVDIMMPRMDGVTMTMKLRENYDFPVIMLTAKSDEQDELLGFQLGVDEYVTKPFSPKILVARVEAILKRTRQNENDVRDYGGIVIDSDGRTVKVDEKNVEMSLREYELLKYREKFACVFQDYRVFAMTVSENVLTEEITDENKETAGRGTQ